MPTDLSPTARALPPVAFTQAEAPGLVMAVLNGQPAAADRVDSGQELRAAVATLASRFAAALVPAVSSG
jgi:predicted DNA-binding transcriptional regulator YafY